MREIDRDGQNPILTIAIPSYNRADSLELLLNTLLRELQGLEGRVAVVIGDNASDDRTPDVTAAFAAAWPETCVIRQKQNLGMDGNFCACAAEVDTNYFWMTGDDDLPRAGAVRALISLLENEKPDLVYVASQWLPDIPNNDPDHPVTKLAAVSLDRLAFARRTNVWTTYLSGMIVRTPDLVKQPELLRKYSGSHLSQLAWVLPWLLHGSRFVYVVTPCVLAKQGNTGGYRVLQVFGGYFPEIVRQVLSGNDRNVALQKAILKRTALGYLPALVLGMRRSTLGRFEQENAANVLRPQFGRSLAYFLLLRPIGHAPLPLARVAVLAARLLAVMLKVTDRFDERVRGAVKSVHQ